MFSFEAEEWTPGAPGPCLTVLRVSQELMRTTLIVDA